VIETAQSVNFQQRVVVLGSYFEKIIPVINKYQIKVINNKNWEAGQSTSVKMGVSFFMGERIDAILFLLVDQPQITISMINKILNLFAYQKNNIIVHNYKGQNRHPILFSHCTFKDLINIQGDQGGRQLFEKYSPFKISLESEYLAIDIDSVNDLNKLDS
jgi:molybdenum cofactor cytidylyltransferase